MGWASEWVVGRPFWLGHRLLLMGSPSPRCFLHPFYQLGMVSRYFYRGAKAVGLGSEHLGSSPALLPTSCVTSGKFLNLSGLLFCFKKKKREANYACLMVLLEY